jgi:Uma2 family endonuclease
MATALKMPAHYVEQYTGIVIFQPREGQNRNALYEEICRVYAEYPKIEQDKEGNVYLMPPGGGEGGKQDLMASAQLTVWALRKGHGEAFGPTTTFVFPSRAKRCPDAVWASNERVYAIPYRKRRGRIPIIPEFVIEIKSPMDVYESLQKKMQGYIVDGVGLGWLIHPDRREVKVYTQVEVGTLTDIEKLRGTGPVKGLTLDLRPIWRGLRGERKNDWFTTWRNNRSATQWAKLILTAGDF